MNISNNDDKLAVIKEKIKHIPGLPDIVIQLLQVIDNPASDIEHIASICSKDAATSAQLLRIANSSFYGFAGEIASIPEACMVLGIHTIRNVVLAAGSLQRFSSHDENVINRNKLWLHSFKVAITSSFIATKMRKDKALGFTAGLLHDIGKFVLDECYPEEYKKIEQQINQQNSSYYELENKLLGFNHAMIGGYIAQQWNLPEPVQFAIFHHHDSIEGGNVIASIVNLANHLVYFLDVPSLSKSTTEMDIASLLEHLSIDTDVIDSWIPEIERLEQDARTLIQA
jgi:putative nucleotidyltransferase with HDIG domain